jgi:LPS sulfotransferase NodH
MKMNRWSARSSPTVRFGPIVRPYLSVFGEVPSERVALIGNPRTGSNYLADGLRTSKCVRMYDEIFAAHNRVIGEDFDRVFATLFRKERRGTRIVGFKLFYNHLTEEEWRRFIAHDEFEVIHLTRANTLRTVVSLDIAFKTGQWTAGRRRNRPASDRVVELDSSQLLGRLQGIREAETRTRERFAGRRVLEVVYEDMVRDPSETFGRVGAFLGVDDVDPERIRIRKQNTEPLRRLIANYDEVSEALQGSEFERCLAE